VIKLQLEKKELEEKKHQSEIRTRQLETIYRAKRISLSPQDAEAFQLFRKIVTEYHYEPTSERKILQHWMNVAFHDFSDRLENRCKDLSEREKDICYLSALGLDCENIAEILEVQPRSIERYISNICKKLGFEKGTKKLFVDFIGRWK
jgi:DNA-binding NarL/FixJ family response regulator